MSVVRLSRVVKLSYIKVEVVKDLELEMGSFEYEKWSDEYVVRLSDYNVKTDDVDRVKLLVNIETNTTSGGGTTVFVNSRELFTCKAKCYRCPPTICEKELILNIEDVYRIKFKLWTQSPFGGGYAKINYCYLFIYLREGATPPAEGVGNFVEIELLSGLELRVPVVGEDSKSINALITWIPNITKVTKAELVSEIKINASTFGTGFSIIFNGRDVISKTYQYYQSGGYYLEADVTGLLRNGVNTLTVKIWNQGYCLVKYVRLRIYYEGTNTFTHSITWSSIPEEWVWITLIIGGIITVILGGLVLHMTLTRPVVVVEKD